MKKFSIILSSAAISFALSGCTAKTNSDNSNQTNSNSLISIFSTNSANTNAANAQPASTPLPTFTDADTALSEGKKLLDANQTEKAAEAFRQAVKLNPDLAEGYFNLGVAYALLEKESDQLPAEEPTPAASKGKKGKNDAVILTKSDKAFDNAAKAYEKLIKKDPKNDNAYFNLGRSYNKLNKDPEAEKALRQAVKLKPDDSEYQTELGAILIKLAKYDDAEVILKKALEVDPDNSHTQDLLDKADAGQKRISFGAKPKTPETSSKKRPAKTDSADDTDDSAPTDPAGTTPPKTSTPSTQPAPTKPAPSTKPVLNKKGNVT